jgi:hypothetical protein
MICPYCGCEMEKLSQNHHYCHGDNLSLVKRWVMIPMYQLSEHETELVTKFHGERKRK